MMNAARINSHVLFVKIILNNSGSEEWEYYLGNIIKIQYK